MLPHAPVKQFRFPRFGENGYTQWVLQGEKGIYDSEDQIRVEEMALRVYSGDERMARELSLDSPEATIRLKEDRAFADSAIEIVGANFKISGTGWEWIGARKMIVVEADTLVEFSQSIDKSLSGIESDAAARRTVISSDRLVLITGEQAYHFEFTGRVQARSGTMDLRSNSLIAEADAPKGTSGDAAAIEPGKLDSIRKITAREKVVILSEGRTVRAGVAEFLPHSNELTLTGLPQIEVAGAFLSGAVVQSRLGEIRVDGSEADGRAQMILTNTGGLGLQGMSSLSEETIVLARTITMQATEGGHRFRFDGEIEVMSGSVQLRSESMTILADTNTKTESTAKDGSLQVGAVNQLIAEGQVRIEQDGQVATGDKVVFYPLEERCELTGQPQVTSGEAIVRGQRMELRPKQALVEGNGENKVSVELPAMPDLGYGDFKLHPSGEASPEQTIVAPLERTVVRSGLLRMRQEPEQTVFHFSKEVEVSATNLKASSGRLEVFALKREVSNPREKVTQGLELARIEAHDKVEIRQTERIATAERAFILPMEAKVVLEDNAVVKDELGQVSGYRMTLLQGQRRAIVEGGMPGQERATITLPALPDSSKGSPK